MKQILIFLILLIASDTIAQEEKTVTIKVIGQGKTQNEAKQSALRSAIEQAYGAFISSKTEILNDQVIADQISSVSSGNIKNYETLNESQFPDGTWGVTLNANVSVDKLISFVQSKGIEIEIKGGLFATNIKQQLLNEQGEVNAVSQMIGLLHETMQTAFDYELKSGEPKSLDSESKTWAIPLIVSAKANRNMDFCANYFRRTLYALSLSEVELANYKSLNKQVFPVNILFGPMNQGTFYLRKLTSINALNTLLRSWEGYVRSFKVQSGFDEIIGGGEAILIVHAVEIEGEIGKRNETGEGSIHDFGYPRSEEVKIKFLASGDLAGIFSWDDRRTLQQIEQMSGYTIKPYGVNSMTYHGGFVVYDENGHGLVAAIMDIDYGKIYNGEQIGTWDSANTLCEELVLNGYNDWRLPTKDELNQIYINLHRTKGIGGFSTYIEYWSSTPSTMDRGNFWSQSFKKGYQNNGPGASYGNEPRLYARAVRTF